MNTHPGSPKIILTTAALAALAVLALVALSGASASAAAKPKSYQCQHPLVTGQEAINPKGVSPKEACRVVRSLSKYLSSQRNVETLYECKGASPKKPGRPVLLQTEFEGWKLKIHLGFGLIMHKAGASFLVTGQDFPINCT